MKAIGFLLILCFVFCVSNLEAQSGKRKKIPRKSSKIAKTKVVKKIPKTISAGVVNGRAVDLVRPEYPQAARAINLYGTVVVQVLIDENGDVVSAQAVSGHLLLRSVCVKAALQSKFKPMILGGESVRVTGFIHYYFTPEQWNWLEIGYALIHDADYYSIKRLLGTLPFGYAEERQLLETAENREESIETIIALIRGKLSNDEKAFWLFEIGMILAKTNRYCCEADEEMENFARQIKSLIQSKPAKISADFISNLEKLVLLIENPSLNIYEPDEDSQIYILLKDFNEKFPFWGK